MTRAELKREAKNTLRGRWGTAIGMLLIYGFIVGAISFIGGFVPLVGSIAVVAVSVPLAFGFTGQMLKYSRKQDVGFFDFFTIGFNNFSKSWSIVGRTLLKLLPYVIIYAVCLIIFTIVAAVAGVMVVSTTFGAIGANTEHLSELSEIFEGTISGVAVILPIIFIVFFVVSILLTIQTYFYVLTEYIGNDNPEMSARDVVEKSKELMTGNRWRFFVLNLSFIGWIILAGFTFGIGYLWLAPYMEVTLIKFYEDLIGNIKGNNVVEVIQ